MGEAVNGQHASASSEWWTPSLIVDPARSLWGFDLDPASCEGANRIVQARRFFTAAEDGLQQHWAANVVWNNPPSKRGENAAWEWWCHGARHWSLGLTGRLWFMVFNPSLFWTKAQEEARRMGVPTPQQAIRVEFAERVCYLRATPQGELFGPVTGHAVEPGKAPPHGSALLLLTDQREDAQFVAEAYRELGEVVVPWRWAERATPFLPREVGNG